MDAILSREFRFEAAHRNLSAPPDSRCGRAHGHSYGVSVHVSGTIDSQSGWVEDFATIKAKAKPVISELDHRSLNDIDGMGDTSLRDVERWLAERLRRTLPNYAACNVRILGEISFDPVVSPTGKEKMTSLRIRCGFAAAHYLPLLPDTHKCRRLHGHSFRLEVVTRDVARAIARLAALYPVVDHRLLNAIDGLENPTSEHLAVWFWERLRGQRVSLDQITIRETCTAACTIRSG